MFVTEDDNYLVSEDDGFILLENESAEVDLVSIVNGSSSQSGNANCFLNLNTSILAQSNQLSSLQINCNLACISGGQSNEISSLSCFVNLNADVFIISNVVGRVANPNNSSKYYILSYENVFISQLKIESEICEVNVKSLIREGVLNDSANS